MLKVIICILAGLCAGVGTGFAGMSAAAVISPMLITFLHMDPYMAVGIALASDVLASAASAVTYARNRNLDIRNGVIMMVSVLAFTLVGSGVASLVPQTTMGNFSVFMTLLLGIKFIVKPVMAPKQRFAQATGRQKAIRSIIGGSVVGFICGFIGAGGGMMMLLVLTSILGYELKTAVGTSVFIMSATALTGSVSHFVIGGMPDVEALILCVISTLAFAQISSFFANKASPKVLNRVTGGILVALGTAILAVSRFA
ncbi:MAG: sulfite exporter TauE/SafE family protein [Eubacteriales bacterium]|nr:sulfite exporter TauE/SafE family protein [Oscillospiraceae bacterium]MDY3925340.1 sulfite exporter TauE/SafE family protein [Eubacteriales bacterium]